MSKYCEICDEPLDPERCTPNELQDGVHSHCKTPGVDSSANDKAYQDDVEWYIDMGGM